ncbi:MAG: ethanolamine ammonia-lyase subunit EutB, partial [Thiomonas sp.]|nr:ethanolamine ammonia-lyase subunit EutB [Thiomonas sp.]
MPYAHTVGSVRHVFPELKTLLARASPLRSGDELAGIAAGSQEERMAARMALADVPLS